MCVYPAFDVYFYWMLYTVFNTFITRNKNKNQWTFAYKSLCIYLDFSDVIVYIIFSVSPFACIVCWCVCVSVLGFVSTQNVSF